jgi:tRNA 2-thiouridine synthesizing protein A
MGERRLDLRGLRCPWPALRVARALREAAVDDILLVMADDPAAPGEIAAVAAERGWTLTAAGAALHLAREART